MRDSGFYWYPEHGNFGNWLEQDDSVAGGDSLVITSRLGYCNPSQTNSTQPDYCRGYDVQQGARVDIVGAAYLTGTTEGWMARRTDEDSGNPYMYFKLDDGFMVGSPVTLTVTYFDAGTDSWELQYDATSSAYKSAGIVSKTSSNTWKKKTFVLNDAAFSNRQDGDSDFRLNSRDDGDEVIHMVVVEREPDIEWPTMTPTATATAGGSTSTSTATSTRTQTPTPTATRTASATNSGPTATASATPTATATPSPTATGGGPVAWIAADTTLDQYNPATNYGASSNLRLVEDSREEILLRFDVSGVPAGAIITHAEMQLYFGTRSTADTIMAAAYGVKRAWTESEANWYGAMAGEAWGVSGANDPQTDRLDTPAATTTLYDVGWATWDLTALVQDWVDGSLPAAGVLIRGEDGIHPYVRYEAYSKEHADEAKRPRLLVEYYVPTPTPTPTPKYTYTPTATSIPTFSVFQEGLDGYQGVKDTSLDAWNPGAVYGGDTALWVRGDGAREVLLSFDVSGIPTYATVQQAVLGMWVQYGYPTGQSMTVSVHQLLRDWTELEATWNSASGSTPWQTPGAQGPTDSMSTPEDTQTLLASNTWVSFDLTELVAQWVIDPDSNHGVLLKGPGVGSMYFKLPASEYTISTDTRPKLQVNFSLPSVIPSATPTLTTTPTGTSSPTSTVTPTASGTPTETATWTLTPTSTATGTQTMTPTSTATSEFTHTPTATSELTHTPTSTVTGTTSPSPTATATTTGTCESRIALSVTELDYGSLPVGETDSQDVWVSFPPIVGGCSHLIIDGVRLNGDGFTLLSPSVFPLEVPKGQYAIFKIGFAPEQAGEYDGLITILSDAVNAEEGVVSLHGVGMGRMRLPLILRAAY